MRRVSILPSLLTIGNFTCGFIAIVLCLQAMRFSAMGSGLERVQKSPALDRELRQQIAGDLCVDKIRSAELLRWACLVIFLAMIFDMLDGRVARMTGAESRFGGELDSLADGCSFGVAPALIVVTLWVQAQPGYAQWWSLVMICGAAYAACATLRLARYNVEIGIADKTYFMGLPSPGAAGCVASTVLFCQAGHLEPLWQWLVDRVPPVQEASEMQARVLGIYMLVVGLLMVTRLRFVHVTNRYLGGRRRFTSLVAAIFFLALLCERPAEVLFTAFNGYVLFSLLDNALRRRRLRIAMAEAPVGEPAPAPSVIRDDSP
jgi:CDP-diacylglycerol---serine O-phosphatidyltransferase